MQAGQSFPSSAADGEGGLYRQVFDELTCGAVAILERTPDGGNFTFLDVNRRFAGLFDREPATVAGAALTDLLPNAPVCGLLDLLKRVHQSGRPERKPILVFEGDRIVGWRDASAFRLSDSDLIVCSFPNMDVLHDVIDNVFGYIGIYSTDGILIDANKAPLEAAGLKREDVIGKPFWETYWWSHCKETQARIRDGLERAARGEVVRGDYSLRLGENEIITIDATVGPVRNDDGEITSLVGFGVDVTERVRATEDLRHSQHLFRTFIDNSPSIIALKTRDGRFLIANKAQEQFGRISNNDVPGKSSFDVFPAAQSRKAVEHDRRVIEEKAAVTLEREMSTPEGLRNVLVTKFPIFDAKGDVHQIGIVGTDITETRRAEDSVRVHERRIRHLEQNLARLERVSSLGTMLSGLAHELNQPLAALQVYGNRLMAMSRDWTDPPDGLIEALGEMQRLTELATKIMLRLRGSVEPSSPDPQEIDCRDTVAEVLDLIRPEVAAGGVKMSFDHPGTGVPLRANAVDLQLILSNLIRNAKEALTVAGTSEPHIRVAISADPAQDRICISVADNGPGIDVISKEMVFMPFFTTKDTGMGLGLAMAQRLAEGMDGYISIHDGQSEGTIVRVCVPRRGADDA